MINSDTWSSVLAKTSLGLGVKIHSFRDGSATFGGLLCCHTCLDPFAPVRKSDRRKMVADGENVDPVEKKIIRQVLWNIMANFSPATVNIYRWNIISGTLTCRGTSSFRKRQSQTMDGWVLILLWQLVLVSHILILLAFLLFLFHTSTGVCRWPWRPCWSSKGCQTCPR